MLQDRKLLNRDKIEFEANQKLIDLENIVQALRNNRLSVFAGAGLSAESGYVNWKQLISPMCDYLGLNINTDLTMIAQYYENECTRDGLNRAIFNEFSKVPMQNDNMEILASLPIDTYWTTNYDSIIEDTLRRNDKIVDVIVEQVQYKNYTPGRDAVVYKMHGDKSNPDKAVITKTDYEVYDTYRTVFSKGLVMELIKKTVLFIGFGFSDPNLDRIISIVRHTFEQYSPPNHYCFMRSVSYKDYLDEKGKLNEQKRTEFEQDKRLQDLKVRSMRAYGIQTILVDDFTQITAMLVYIRDKFILNNVFISGALNPSHPHNYGRRFNLKKSDSNFRKGEWFIMHLAKRIIDDGYNIVNGFGVGIGNYVVTGAYMGGEKKGGSDYVSKHLIIQPLISVEQDITTKNNVRRKLISECGTVIFLFGKTPYYDKENDNFNYNQVKEDGTYIEYDIAKKLKKNIIPVGETGWTSKYIYDEVYYDDKNYNYVFNEKFSCEKLIDKIMNMIESEKKNKEIMLRDILMQSVFSKFGTIKVFVSFYFREAKEQSEIIFSILEKERGIESVRESDKKENAGEIKKWIDQKIKNTSVTILLLSKNISKSVWVDREIQKSIEGNNRFVLIDISNDKYDKDFLNKYKIGKKGLNELYKVHHIKDDKNNSEYENVGKWVHDAVDFEQ